MRNHAESGRKRLGPRCRWVALALLGALAIHCSSSPDAITVTHRGDTGPGGSGGGVGGGAGFQTNVDGGSAQTLTVHVEDHDRVAIDLITLRCDGECADVEAVAHGGYEPYTSAWGTLSSLPPG